MGGGEGGGRGGGYIAQSRYRGRVYTLHKIRILVHTCMYMYRCTYMYIPDNEHAFSWLLLFDVFWNISHGYNLPRPPPTQISERCTNNTYMLLHVCNWDLDTRTLECRIHATLALHNLTSRLQTCTTQLIHMLGDHGPYRPDKSISPPKLPSLSLPAPFPSSPLLPVPLLLLLPLSRLAVGAPPCTPCGRPKNRNHSSRVIRSDHTPSTCPYSGVCRG